MRKDFYEIKDEMTAEHKQFIKDLKEARDRSVEELKRQEAVYDKLVSDKSKEILALDAQKKEITKDLDTLRLAITDATKEKATLENKVFSLRITLQGEEKAFQEKLAAFEDEKKKIANERIRDKDLLAKSRAECEAMKMEGSARGRNAEKVLAQVKIEKDEATRIKDNASKQLEEAKSIRNEVVSQLTKIEEIKQSQQEIQLTNERNSIENEKEAERLKNLSSSLDTLNESIKKIAKEQEDKAIDLDLQESENRKMANKVNKLIEIHKLKVK